MKKCAVCGKFQKSITKMILHNGKEVCPKCAAMLNLNESTTSVVQIEAGPRGVTKHQMIPAIKANINNPEALRQLAKDYPTVFNGSVRYLLKKEMQAVKERADELITAFNKQPKAKGVTLTPSGKYSAYYDKNGIRYNIGRFPTQEEAKKAREEFIKNLQK
jgi:hypothetical protein